MHEFDTTEAVFRSTGRTPAATMARISGRIYGWARLFVFGAAALTALVALFVMYTFDVEVPLLFLAIGVLVIWLIFWRFYAAFRRKLNENYENTVVASVYAATILTEDHFIEQLGLTPTQLRWSSLIAWDQARGFTLVDDHIVLVFRTPMGPLVHVLPEFTRQDDNTPIPTGEIMDFLKSKTVLLTVNELAKRARL